MYPHPLRPASWSAFTLLFLAFAACAAAPAENNWPAMRGPQANGVSATATPPLTWSESTHLKWKVKVPGAGNSTPIIWGDRIFLSTAADKNNGSAPTAGARAGPYSESPNGSTLQFTLLCLDRNTGKTLWKQVAAEQIPHEGKHPDDTFASASPVTDGQNVWAFFGSRGLYCYDMEGKLQWSQDLGKMKINQGFGEGASPVLCGDKIIVTWDHEGESFITAFDKLTGKPLWKTPRDEKSAWATPLVVKYEGKTQIITSASGKVRAYDPADGTLLWQCKGLTSNVIPSPVAADGLVFCTSGYQGSAMLAIRPPALALPAPAELPADAIAWKITRNTPYVSSPLLVDGRLYFFSSNNNILTCVDAKTGKTLIEATRIEAFEGGVYASPVSANGRVYLVGRNGVCVVIKAGAAFEILATNTLEDRIDASPALAGKELFLRGRGSLYCIGE